MIGFSGRLGFKQYVPLKPTKRGIKVWVRADPHNGYVGDFQVYTGRTDNTPMLTSRRKKNKYFHHFRDFLAVLFVDLN
jgi:hypothetical protein